MSRENQIQPLHFCCARCLRQGKNIGVRWNCGHINCCLLTFAEEVPCPIPGCFGMEVVERGWFDLRDGHPSARPFGIPHGEWKKAAPKCLLHTDEVVAFVPVSRQWGRVGLVGCKKCHQADPKGFVSIQAPLLESAPFLTDFVQKIKFFDQKVRREGGKFASCPAFRGALDKFVAAEVRAFLDAKAQDVLLGSTRLELKKLRARTLMAQLFHILSVPLEKLGHLLKKLGENLGGFSERRLVERVSNFIAEEAELAGFSEDVGAPGSQFQSAADLKWLLEGKWPFHTSPPSAEVGFWEKTVQTTPNSAPKSQMRALRSVLWSRTAANWQKTALNSRILKGRDVNFVSSVLPLDGGLDLVVRIEEEEGSGSRFHEATGNKRDTILFVQSGPNRFGCWRGPSWSRLSPAYTPACRFFSLNFQTSVESTPNLRDESVPVCPTLGPLEAGGLTSLHRRPK